MRPDRRLQRDGVAFVPVAPLGQRRAGVGAGIEIEREDEVAVRRHEIGLQLQRGAEAGDRLDQHALALAHRAQRVVEARIARIDGERAIDTGGRGGGLAGIELDEAEIAMRFGDVGVALDGAREIMGALRRLAHLRQRDAQRRQRLGMIGIDGQRAVEMAERDLGMAGIAQQRAELHLRLGAAGQELRGALEAGHRLVAPPQIA